MHPKNLKIGTDIDAPNTARVAVTTADDGVDADPVTLFYMAYIVTNSNYYARKFMASDAWELNEWILPMNDV
jgi:hypothetical protein